MEKTIVVRACRNAEDHEHGWDTEETHIETLKEAKQRAKYFLTEEYRNACEASEIMMYSQVVVNGEVVFDYFGEPQAMIAQITWQKGKAPWFVSDLPGHVGLKKEGNPKSDWGYTTDKENAIPLNAYWRRRFTADSRRGGRTVNYFELS